MTEIQFENFIYCCQQMASKLHFNNVDGIVHFIGNKNLEEQTFASVVAKNNQLLKV